MVFASKVKRIYPYLKGILLAAGLVWCLAGYPPRASRDTVLYTLLAYAFLLLVFGWLHKRQFFKTDNLHFISQFLDAAIIAMIIRSTGGLYSEFFLAFFPVIALAAVFNVGWRAFAGAIWYGVCFLWAVYDPSFWRGYWQMAGIRMASIWSVGLVTYSVAHFMRSSESKLLKTLDVLNERTWELESSQAQISDIYETSKTFSGILDMEHLLEEILRVAQRIFRLRTCRIFLANATGDSLYLYGGLENGNRHIYEEPVAHKREQNSSSMSQTRFSDKSSVVVGGQAHEPGRVDIPMISRGNVIGVMQVVSESGTLSSGKDKRLLMVFAGAAAVAIDNSLLHRKTEELTIVDALTGLYNYRYFRGKLVDELRRADRYRQKLSVLMIDIDHFKEVNDRHGHQTGNVVLQQISEIVKLCVRDIDVLARYGGEEFVVILPQTDEDDAISIADRIRDTVEKNRFSDSKGHKGMQMTVSIGLATYPDAALTLEHLLEKVDRALYRAKADGRNLVRIAEKTQRRTVDIG